MMDEVQKPRNSEKQISIFTTEGQIFSKDVLCHFVGLFWLDIYLLQVQILD
jgi:hypothetical protein